MTDIPPAGFPTGAEASDTPTFRVLAQFIRDLSFENPRAPESLRAQPQPPQIDLSVEMNARSRPDGLYETDLKLVVTAQANGEPVFQVELLFGGLFQITGVPEADMEPVLLIECPRYLFPFARRVIADLTGEGGFPPFMLEPIDFGAVYQARLAATTQETGQA
jgi:preprotein translocase subunit SecB